MKTIKIAPIFVLLVVALVQVATGAEQRSGRRISGAGVENSGFKSPCGTADQLSRRGGECLVPIFELIEGRFKQPHDDLDLQSSCSRFNTTSRCVRLIAKDCLSGLHKTSAGAVGSAMRRFYTNECKSVGSRRPYLEPLKCAIKNGPAMKRVYETQTGVMQGIRDLPIAPEEKVIKMCCVLNDIDTEIKKIFDATCPESTAIVIKLVHAVTDDARNTLCVSPRCKGALDKVKSHKYKPPQNFIEPVLQILFQINV